MFSTKEAKPNHQRNITPNFLRFKKKSAPKNPKEDDDHDSQLTNERHDSRASRASIDLYEKRVLHLSKLKNSVGLKEPVLEAAIKKREGLLVTARRNTPPRKPEEERRKTSVSGSNKSLKAKESKEKTERTSNTKRSEESLEREEQRAKQQNRELLNHLMHPQFAPNYINKLKYKKLEKERGREGKEGKEGKESREGREGREKKRKFLSVELEIKGEEELRQYQVYEQLGKGAYGIVKMGISKRTNQKVAIKIYEKRRLDEPNKLRNLEREINILAKLSHPVIAKLIDVIETATEIFLIQEYGGANSLYNYLLSKKEHRLPEAEAKLFFRTIAETLKYLHARNIVHRDIKAENILLNRNKELKLIDFGFSLESAPPATIDTFCGTPTYMAPEIVSKRDHVPIYTDQWSLGVFLFVILQGNYPFRAKNESDLFQKIRRGSFEYIHSDISEKSRQVIERLIRLNPLERMRTADMNEGFWEWFIGDSKPEAWEPTAVTNMTTAN